MSTVVWFGARIDVGTGIPWRVAGATGVMILRHITRLGELVTAPFHIEMLRRQHWLCRGENRWPVALRRLACPCGEQNP